MPCVLLWWVWPAVGHAAAELYGLLLQARLEFVRGDWPHHHRTLLLASSKSSYIEQQRFFCYFIYYFHRIMIGAGFGPVGWCCGVCGVERHSVMHSLEPDRARAHTFNLEWWYSSHEWKHDRVPPAKPNHCVAASRLVLCLGRAMVSQARVVCPSDCCIPWPLVNVSQCYYSIENGLHCTGK